MISSVMKWLPLTLATVLCLQLGYSVPAQAAAESLTGTKELNFVFLHGAGGNACSLQLLADTMQERLAAYVHSYEQANPGIKVKVNVLNRCYPNNVDIATWADNIASTIAKYLPGEGKIILIGHSMGGKAATYAVAKNMCDLAHRVVLVVTINSPIKPLETYSFAGGGSFLTFCRAALLNVDRGVCSSVASYDSSEDGKWVGQNSHWLAFISGENAPLSKQFDYGGIDAFPRDMDDGAIPISAQYSDGADVVYYGEHGHNDFGISDEVANSMAAEILRYIFGGTIECSVLARDGGFGHKAGWGLGTDYWRDLVGDVLGKSGRLWHWNQSYTRWQEWEDVVEYYPPTYEKYKRSRYEARLVKSSKIFTRIGKLHWLEPDNPEDCRLYLQTKAAPRNYIQVDWHIYLQGLLPSGTKRDHYEVRITAGTPLAGVGQVSWATDDPRDLRIEIWSHAESPFRWFQIEWKVFYKENRQRNVIDEIPALPGQPRAGNK